jgi:hypothetical protein
MRSQRRNSGLESASEKKSHNTDEFDRSAGFTP